MAAEVSLEEGITEKRVTAETIRATLERLGKSWQRAKKGWVESSDPEYARKKGARDRLIALAETHPEWALGFCDETWWSRFERPALHGWSEDGKPPRLVEQFVPKDDPDPKALCAYGMLVRSKAGVSGETQGE